MVDIGEIVKIKKCDMYSDNSHHILIGYVDSDWHIAKLSWNFYTKKANMKFYGVNELFQKLCFENRIKRDDLINHLLKFLIAPIKEEFSELYLKNIMLLDGKNFDEYLIDLDDSHVVNDIMDCKKQPLNIANKLDNLFV